MGSLSVRAAASASRRRVGAAVFPGPVSIVHLAPVPLGRLDIRDSRAWSTDALAHYRFR